MDKIVAEKFLQGRELYLSGEPVHGVATALAAIEDEREAGSLLAGFADGLVSDIRAIKRAISERSEP